MTRSMLFPKRCTCLILSLWISDQSLVNAFANNSDLTRYFKTEYVKSVENLSSSDIVEMMPTITAKNEKPLRQELFRSPLISTLYEKVLPPIWEMGLRIGGPDVEYESAAPHLGTGEVALDLSCGTGFVARRMASSGAFQHVFALDYSPQMLSECITSMNRNKGEIGQLPLSIIRGDAGLLPFENQSLDAIHWGAAMHCVPNVEQALEECYRVLKPDGRLYATTFLRPFPDVVFRFFDIDEIQRLACDAGFALNNLDLESRGVYGILQAVK